MSRPAVAERGVGNDPSLAPDWRRAVEPYTGPDARRASFQLVTTLGALAVLMWAMRVGMDGSPLLSMALVLPAAALIVRTFIIMHDCAHGSFFASRRLNDITGFITGVVALTPFVQWRREHALHHASSGDLDRRGHGDVPTLTVREYLALSRGARLRYRIVRHPALLLLGGPFYLVLTQRLRTRGAATGSAQVTSIWLTNATIVALLALALVAVGWQSVLVVYILPYYFAAMAGTWLFYVQHQFEDAYWTPHGEWNYLDAALHGSTHLRLPPLLQWCTGNIGLHHVHHAAPKIPNYRLQSCHDENALFQRSPVATLRSGTAALRLALWDETRGRMIRFCDVTDDRQGVR